jgi:hypothetical protein
MSGYVDAYCVGSGQDAVTSAVYIEVVGSRIPDYMRAMSSDCAQKVLSLLEDKLAWIKNRACFEDDHQRDRLAGIFLAAKEELARRVGA